MRREVLGALNGRSTRTTKILEFAPAFVLADGVDGGRSSGIRVGTLTVVTWTGHRQSYYSVAEKQVKLPHGNQVVVIGGTGDGKACHHVNMLSNLRWFMSMKHQNTRCIPEECTETVIEVLEFEANQYDRDCTKQGFGCTHRPLTRLPQGSPFPGLSLAREHLHTVVPTR